ncbi:hypothetical protein DOY81_002322 [Sarcophaga bullata]|nr:hypothetical protein DOY81_002322 [Sarcophaga bullata]
MSTDKFLNEFCDIIDTYGGRDKVMKALCYGTKLIGGYYADRKPELAKRYAIASSRISGARATLRLIDDIPMIQYALEYGWGQNESDPAMAVLGVIANIVDLLYYPVEKLCWLSEHKIIDLKNADYWDNHKINAIKDPKKSPEDELKIKKHRLEILSLVRLSLDFIHAASYLPKGYLWGGKLSTFQIGAIGTTSAAIGIYQIFAKRRLNK